MSTRWNFDINKIGLKRCDELIRCIEEQYQHAAGSVMTGMLDHRGGLEAYGWAEMNRAEQMLNELKERRRKILEKRKK